MQPCSVGFQDQDGAQFCRRRLGKMLKCCRPGIRVIAWQIAFEPSHNQGGRCPMEANCEQAQQDDPVAERPAVCGQCGSGEIEQGFRTPLCVRCRTLLARRPFPIWIKASSVVLLGMVAFAGLRSVESIHAAAAFERGKQAERHKDYAQAAEYYQQAAEQFPDSTLALVRLAVTRVRAGQAPEAIEALDRLNGRKMPRELAAEAEQALHELEGLLK